MAILNTKDGCIAIGIVGKEPEQKIAGQNTVTKFSIRYGQDKTITDENGRHPAKWLNIDVRGSLGDAAMMLSKGDAILAAGDLQSREYNGNTYHTLKAQLIVPGLLEQLRIFQQMISAAGMAAGQPIPQPQAPAAAPNPVPDPGDFAPIEGGSEDLPF